MGPSASMAGDPNCLSDRIAFSPDGKQFAFVRNETGNSKTALIVADTQGPAEHELALSSGKWGFAWHSPSWSPDGENIALGAPVNDSGSDNEVFLVNVASSAMRPLTKHGWSGVASVTWRHDGSGLIVIARDKNSTLWPTVERLVSRRRCAAHRDRLEHLRLLGKPVGR